MDCDGCMLQFYPMNHTGSAEKIFIAEQDLMLDGFRLGRSIHESGFRPDFIVGIWRGGSAVGIVVQECLQYLGVETDHIPIRTSYRGLSSYQEMIRESNNIRVHGIDYLLRKLDAEHQLLLVDDVFSSGHSMQAVTERLQRKLRQNMPQTVRTAAVWHRPIEGRPQPDYFVNTTDKWLVLPYEITGLSAEELAEHKPAVAGIAANLMSS